MLNNLQTITLVAITLSTVSLVFAITGISTLQNSLQDIQIKNTKQSKIIENLTSQLNDRQQAIGNQNVIISELQNNITSISSKMKSLEDRISSLEQKVDQNIPPPPPMVSQFHPVTISDENGNHWTSQYIKEGKYYSSLAAESCNSDGMYCYMNMSKTVWYNKTAIEADTVGSPVHSYWFFGYSDVHIVPQSGSITVSGEFLKNDLFSPDMAEPRSFVSVFLLSDDEQAILDEHMIVPYSDKNET
ncbi:MAG: coiled-coil domain-containing protein, partial [Nitrosotalea sp.]